MVMAVTVSYLYKIVSRKQPEASVTYFLLFKGHHKIKIVSMGRSAELHHLEILFLPYAIEEYKKLDPDARNAETYVSL